jgi:protein TonB
MAQDRTDLEEHVVLQRPHAIERDIRRITRRADYGWLAETLWAALERHKRYPSVARMNRWEGRVVVRVSVRRDGQLVNPEVEESSGYPVLDQAAVDVVQQASPLPLKYALEQSLVPVSIPLTYQLE